MGHWQYILYVNTTLFVLHCISSLCSFIIPVRIQSFSWANLIWRGHDLNIIFSGERKEKEYLSYFVSTVMGSSRGGRLRCPQDRLRLDQTFNITVSPSWLVARGEEVQKRNPNKKKHRRDKNLSPPDLWLTVAFFDPSRWITVNLHHESYILFWM